MRAPTSWGPPRRNWSPPAICARTVRKSSARCAGSSGNISSIPAARSGGSLSGARGPGPMITGKGRSVADIVLINPRFEVSFWGLEYALPLLGKRANLPVAALPLLAALTPEGHTITLIDENVEPIDFDRCARADLVGVTGMSVQRYRMTEI